ncbi:hypothetical protein BKP45_07300 [Anaerobacillus alkalidiazotrophicus]|uniref:Uncharacterized protein n=1 Tax=Anaerobacillus alkalidiazotrophicus TaxID=472963 RepID=A0A1S2MCC1_9BACI|nr:CBO0543 family protein [Anaerobacillus alkalidiazotrophicus]OIJ22432.1 hypothetical protein BKP45_07300 [Anaerobacillus alkalidiazotrophicus]
MSNQPTWEEIVNLREILKETNVQYWLNENLFTFPWWFLLITMILFWVIWWIIVDKSKLMEILLYGIMATVIVILLDVIGVSLMLWGYPNMLTPLIPPIFAIDVGHLPVLYMALYQYFPSWKSFLAAMIIAAFVFAFIFEPFTVWLGIYELNNWKYIYSFPIYILIGVFLKWLLIKVKCLESYSSSQ